MSSILVSVWKDGLTMATTDQPITKADLQAELRYYATKEDIARLEGKIDNVANVLMIRLGGLLIVVASVLFAALRYLE